MALVRLWFVAFVAAALLRSEPLVIDEPEYVDTHFVDPFIDPKDIPQIPEYKFFSFLNQKTGTWDKELR